MFDTDDEYIGKAWTHRSKSRLTRIQTQQIGQRDSLPCNLVFVICVSVDRNKWKMAGGTVWEGTVHL